MVPRLRCPGDFEMDYRKLKATAFAVGGLSASVALTLFGADGARAQAPAPAQPAAAQPAATQPAAKKAVPKQSAEAKAAKKDPAQALQTIEQAQKLLQSGKADNAVSTLSGVISGGNLPGNVMARALYVRGLAHRKMTKPALAISDLQSALWIKNGLTDNERTDALQNRAAAYRDAGLPDQADDSIKTASATPAAAKSAAPVQAPTATAPAAPSPTPVALAPDPAPSQQQASASGLGGIFGNLFNSGGAASAPAATTPEQAEAKRQLRRDEATAARAAARQASPITTNSVPAPAQETKPAATPAVSSSPPAPIPAQAAAPAAPKQKVAAAAGPAAATAAPQAATGGSTRLQLGLVRTEAEARASALKVQQLLGAAAGAVSIDQTQVGSMGTFYRVRMGAFPSESAGAQQCAKVKAAGVDCIPLAQ